MIDEMRRNPVTVSGSPTTTPGALTIDQDLALTFPNAASASAADSASLSITGSLSIELFLKLSAIPGATKTILRKTGSYTIQVNSSGKLLFVVENGASNATVTSSATLTTDVWYQIVCVCNQNYNGVQQFGRSTSSYPTGAQVDDTNGNNKAVSKFTLSELALLTSVTMNIWFIDEIYAVTMIPVIYTDAAGVPSTLVARGAGKVLYPPSPAWRATSWINFPLEPAVAPAGDYHLGYVSDTTGIGAAKAPLVIGNVATGGTTSKRPDDITSPDTSFGSVVVSNANIYDVYCDYTALARTGREGKASIYLNGAFDNSANYTAGIADTANSLEFFPDADFAASLDEVSVWDRALSDVEVALHRLAH